MRVLSWQWPDTVCWLGWYQKRLLCLPKYVSLHLLFEQCAFLWDWQSIKCGYLADSGPILYASRDDTKEVIVSTKRYQPVPTVWAVCVLMRLVIIQMRLLCWQWPHTVCWLGWYQKRLLCVYQKMWTSTYCSNSMRSNATGNHPNAVTGLKVAKDCMLAWMIPNEAIVSSKRC